jgi:hypothetical protein
MQIKKVIEKFYQVHSKTGRFHDSSKLFKSKIIYNVFLRNFHHKLNMNVVIIGLLLAVYNAEIIVMIYEVKLSNSIQDFKLCHLIHIHIVIFPSLFI